MLSSFVAISPDNSPQKIGIIRKVIKRENVHVYREYSRALRLSFSDLGDRWQDLMTPSQPTAVGIVEKVLSLSEDERLLQSFALLATVRESLDKNNGEFPKLPVLPLHSPPATTGRKKNWDDEKKNGGEEENQNCKTATSLVSDDDFIFAMRNLLNEEFHWKGKLRGLKEGQALLNSPIHAEKFEKLELTARKLHFAKSSLTSELDWVFAQVAFGITTSYRREPNGTLSLKLEGELNDVPLFEQLAVLREIDFYSLWAPFMTESKTLMQVNKIELLGWFKIAVPIFGLVRDAVFHAFGCDCMKEDGTIMLVAESIEAENAKNLGLCKVPEAPKGIGKARIFIHSFSGLVEVKSPVSARTRLIANLDPKIALPQALIDFAMKKMAGILLYVMQKMSKKVVKDPICSHAVRIREDREFYQDWLLPKFDEYCSLRQWDMSPVAALEYGKDEMEKVDVCGDGGVDGNLSPGKKKRNIIYRGGHKIRKRIRQRKQREVEEEIAALKLEGENNSYDMPHLLSPEFRDRYISWSARKIEVSHATSLRSGAVCDDKRQPCAEVCHHN